MSSRERLRRFQRLQSLSNLQIDNDLIARHYYTHVDKVRVYDTSFNGSRWMDDILNSSTETRCFNAFRMEKQVFHDLCNLLINNYGLRGSKNMQPKEKAGIFVYTMAHGLNYRTVSERFQRSTSTISSTIHEVLNAIVGRRRGFQGMAKDIIKPTDPLFTEVPDHIKNDTRYSQYFEGAIGCIDGTHINACIPEADQVPYRGRKGICTFNVMAVCDFDMCFTFISAGWEGSAHDAKVFAQAVSTPSMGFPHPPPGRYYLVDKGYPDKEGYMVPYPKTRYHLSQFENVAPGNAKEAFNKRHSSLRSCIERSFGVLKACWKILKVMPSYSVSTQVDIILACFALHNFRRKSRSTTHDTTDDLGEAMLHSDAEDDRDSNEAAGDTNDPVSGGLTRQIRDDIAAKLWADI